jgi:hypothetical protein
LVVGAITAVALWLEFGSGGGTSVLRKKGTPAIDDGNAMSWDSFTGAPLP